MTKDELDILRRRVANEPGDERGALARILMAEIDRLTGAREVKARADLIEALVSSWHLTTEEATRYVDTEPLPTFSVRRGKCRACGGSGSKTVMQCMGSRSEACETCDGSGTSMGLALPWETQ